MSKKRPQAPRDAARSSEPKPGEDVVSLITERKQIDDWIAALDAKKEQTPPKVFTRVRGDYETRLRVVVDKLASHHSSLGAELTGLEKKLEKIDDEIEAQQEERAEIELRSNVGELDTSAVGDAFRDVDAELAHLAASRASLEADLIRVTEFFAAAGGGPAPASVAGDSRRSAGGFDELSFLNSVVGDPAGAKGSPPKGKTSERDRGAATAPAPVAKPEPTPAATPPEPPPAATPAPVAAVSPPAAPAEVPKPVVERVELPPRKTVEAPAQAAEAKPTPKEPAKPAGLELERDTEPLVAPPPKRDPRLSIAMQQASMTIEPEDVAPRSSIGIVKTNEGPSQLLEGIAPASPADEKPFAANVASNNPLSLKSSAKGDIKTLKCRECGAMNDPTEWYCERCGAELSGV